MQNSRADLTLALMRERDAQTARRTPGDARRRISIICFSLRSLGVFAVAKKLRTRCRDNRARKCAHRSNAV
jgi:hypothetical protein